MFSSADKQSAKGNRLLKLAKENANAKIFMKLEKYITGKADIQGESEPSLLFYLMSGKLGNLLSDNTEEVLSAKTIKFRKKLNPIIKAVAPAFLEHKQIIESKNKLLGIDEPDTPLALPAKPVIWCANHGFKDDALATILVARHSYIFFGSLPMFFNTFDGLSAYANGVVLCNRKVAASRRSSTEKAIKALSLGTDLLLFPEGVWNKTPDKLMLDFWPGVYRLSHQTGCPVVPVIHYLPDPHDKNSKIHTLVSDPISMEGLSEEEGLGLLRDTMATWYYLLMEKYGKTTRAELLNGYENADQAWEDYLEKHTGTVPYYDREIELKADYRRKEIPLPQNVYSPIAEIKVITPENAFAIANATQEVSASFARDFQRRF